MQILLASIGFGLVSAALLAIQAVAFTLQFAVTNILNLALGAMMTADGFIAYAVNHAGLPIWPSVAVAGVFGAVLAAVINWVIYMPFARHGTKLVGMVIVTLSVGIILSHLIQGIVGPSFFAYTWDPGRSINVGDMVFTTTQLFTILIAVIAMALVHGGLRYTAVGKAMRATAADTSLAKACGIKVRRVTTIAWLVSGALSGIGAVLFFMDTSSFSATTASEFLIVVIAAAVLGGVGQAYGAMLGALIVGISTEVAAAYINPALKDVVAFVILGLVLLIRPRGILSEVATEKAVAA